MANEDRVRVVVRVRPKQSDEPLWVHVTDKTRIQTVNDRNTNEALQYRFARVFGPDSDQRDLYMDTVYPLLESTLQGKNSSVFAYGPTGAGKTFTMLGTEDHPGLIPHCIKDFFSMVEHEKTVHEGNWRITMSFSYLEIYNEKVLDLLQKSEKPLQIVEDQNKQIVVMGLTEKTVESVNQFIEVFSPASNNRTTAATGLNERSSRSHSLLMLKVSKVQKVAPFRRLTGKLYLIDLAGSEDNRRTGNVGVRLQESGAINTSLLFLGQVVDALNKGSAYIPYRGSKLTRLLQDSLGGSAMTTIIVNLSPEESHYNDTKTTLNFARKSKKIVNKVQVHETFDKPLDHFAEKKPVVIFLDESDSSQQPVLPHSPKRILSPLLRSQKQLQKGQEELHKGQEQLREELNELKKLTRELRHGTSAPPHTQSKQIVDEDNTSVANCDNDLPVFEESKENRTPFLPRVSVLDTDFDSPLLLPLKTRKRRFRSVASRSYIKVPDTPDEKFRRHNRPAENFNPEGQQRRNEYILNILNTGSVKTLVEKLSTVGLKRAQTIYDYREMHGLFKSFEDLYRIGPLKEKYIDNLLKNNFVTL